MTSTAIAKESSCTQLTLRGVVGDQLIDELLREVPECDSRLSKRDNRRIADTQRAIRLAEIGELGQAASILLRCFGSRRLDDESQITEVAHYLYCAVSYLRRGHVRDYGGNKGYCEGLALLMIGRRKRPALLPYVLRLYPLIALAEVERWGGDLTPEERASVVEDKKSRLVRMMKEQASGHGFPLTKVEEKGLMAAMSMC